MRTSLKDLKLKLKSNKKLLALDIDSTLYDSSIPIESNGKKYLMEYLQNKYKMEDIEGLFMNFRERYGSALRGFLENYPDFEYKEYIDNVTNKINFNELPVDNELKKLLDQYTGNLIAFTNAPKLNAEKILKQMQIEDCFDYILHVDTEDRNYPCKPDETVYKFIERISGVKLENIYFVDDRMVNVAAAQNRKWNGIRVSRVCDIKSILKSIYDDFKKL